MSKFILKEGLNDCTNEQYHSDSSFYSSTALKLLYKNPYDFYDQYLLGNKQNIKRAVFDEGTYAHSLILEPEMIPKEFAFYPGLQKRGKAWTQFQEDNPGKILLSKTQKMRIDKLYDVYSEHSVAKGLIDGGASEYTLAGILEGVPVKVRADYINLEKGYIVDVKTTSMGTDVNSFKNTIDQFSYQLSAALYTKVFENFYNKSFGFYFIVLGKKEYTCDVYKVSEGTMNMGITQVREALSTFKRCTKTGIWNNRSQYGKIIEKVDSNYEILEV